MALSEGTVLSNSKAAWGVWI